jgi:Protein of unknown function (DUF3275)
MIPIQGQLAIKTRRGRYGDFNVGYLSTSIGEFVTKNAELDQHKEGKYEGEFIITEIFPASYITGGRVVVELRAKLGGMTITGIDELTAVDSQRLNPQETDPIDEQNAAPQSPPQAPVAPEVVPTPEVAASSAVDPLIDTTPFGVSPDVSDVSPDKKPEANNSEAQGADQALFGLLWPLTNVVKLDATVERRVYRQQCARLDKLGYGFEALTQDWHLKAA